MNCKGNTQLDTVGETRQGKSFWGRLLTECLLECCSQHDSSVDSSDVCVDGPGLHHRLSFNFSVEYSSEVRIIV